MPWIYCSLEGLLYYPIPPPLFVDVPTSAARCLHACNDARDPSSERWNCVGKKVPVILPKWWLLHHLGILYMPQIYDVGPTAFLPLRRKVCWGFFRPVKYRWLWPGLNPWTQVLKGSTLPLDRWSRFTILRDSKVMIYSTITRIPQRILWASCYDSPPTGCILGYVIQTNHAIWICGSALYYDVRTMMTSPNDAFLRMYPHC